ncbi:hypothetical protein [Streptomyces sp. NPDC097610]|uniref:hypothetical protein n=1 Tax=Streptomyces sp. NPDC097610 TaxID=3157227 RepID=UPI003327BD48
MLDQAMARVAGRFGRVEPRAMARAFILGLLPGVERKNCWQLAEEDRIPSAEDAFDGDSPLVSAT